MAKPEKARPRGNKYGAVRVQVDGHHFDSKLEAKRYAELRLMEKAGEISGLDVHPAYDVTVNGIPICKVILDFAYVLNGVLIVEDTKGKDNALSRLKRRLVEAQHGLKVNLIDAGVSRRNK
jgi:hypothetical protein